MTDTLTQWPAPREEPAGLNIRIATPADAALLAKMGADTFSETFAHLYRPEDLAAFLAAYHTPEAWAPYLADPASRVWIAEANGEAIGYALAGPCGLPHPDVTPTCGELKRIYVYKSAQGLGAGSKLLGVALDWLTRPGRDLWIGVWSENHGAQRLYGRHGFERAGEYDFIVGEQRDYEFILRRRG
jgi:GNAT superfamily N-acetyltransferase